MADFIFADEYRLEEGETRRFHEAFLKGLVHKYNNLMGVIQGFNSLILYDDSISREVRENAEQLETASRQTSELNRVVLAAAGSGRCEPGPVRLADLHAYWQDKAAGICAEQGVAFQFTAREGVPAVQADSTRISEIFVHLVRNAAEAAAGGPEGAVAVDLFPPGEASGGRTVDLFIRNSSAELSEAKLREAFTPFHTTKGADHFGIGLTTAAVLAGQMGMRLGLRYADGTTTAWLAMPPAG